MGAVALAAQFNSSDYAWYNLEEGRYTGVSANWHISKQRLVQRHRDRRLGHVLRRASHGVGLPAQVNYWLDRRPRRPRSGRTVLTGPTCFVAGKHGLTPRSSNSGYQHNYNEYWYQIIDTQMVWSTGPIFGPASPATMNAPTTSTPTSARHLDCKWTSTPASSGIGTGRPAAIRAASACRNTDYFEVTVGPDYHPTKWLQFRPEIRYDHATNPNFGATGSQRNQLDSGYRSSVQVLT